MPNKEIFKIEEIPFDDYAASLGLAATPSLRFLKELKSKSREDLRGVKNVNRKLERLKEQIKAEKLRKQLEKLGKSSAEDANILSKRKRVDDDDDILVMKKQHDWNEEGDENLPNVNINQVSKARNEKRIRVDGGNGDNRHIVFTDDGEEREDDMRLILKPSGGFGGDAIKAEKLAEANEDYLRRVKERLSANKEIDRKEEKERIREKHKLKKLKAKEDEGAGDQGDENVMVTLGTADENAQSQTASDQSDSESMDSSRSSSDDSDDSSDESSSSSDSIDEDPDEMDIKKQEEIALALIHGKENK
jgi:ATP-dependent RNA helicase DDX10/DBP4